MYKRKLAFYATADFWREQTDEKTLLYEKSQWKRFSELENLYAECAFCEYFSCDIISNRPPCPLGGKNFSVDSCAGGHYSEWYIDWNSDEDRIAAAKKIWEKIKAFMLDHYPEYFSQSKELKGEE